MLKRRNLILLSIIAVTAALIYLSIKYFNSNSADNLPIPESTILIYQYEGEIGEDSLSNRYKTWQNLKSLPPLENALNHIRNLDSNLSLNPLVELINQNGLTASLHASSNHDFDFIYFIPLSNKNSLGLLDSIKSSILKNKNINYSTRTYQGEKIESFNNAKNKLGVSSVIIGNTLIFSEIPFLIEDVIRIKNGSAKSFKTNTFYNNFEDIPSNINEGRILINTNKISSIIESISSSHQPGDNILNTLLNITGYNITVNDDKIFFNGSSVKNRANPSFLDVFENLEPSEFTLKDYVPMNTAMFLGLGVENGKSFQNSLKNFLNQNKQGSTVKYWYQLNSESEIYIDKLFEFIDDEIGLSVQESFDEKAQSRILFIKTSNAVDFSTYLNSINEKFYKNSDENEVFTENYRSNEIWEMQKTEFPEMVFGKLFSGFPRSFYTIHEDVLIISNNIKSLRQTLDDIDDESVWGKSVKMNLFLEQGINNSNVNIIFNTSRLWQGLINSSDELWKERFESNKNTLKNFELIAFQFSKVENGFYSGGLIQVKDKVTQEKTRESKPETPLRFKHDSKIITRPIVVRNHNTNAFEVLIQDEQNNLILVSSNGNKLWSKKLKKAIDDDHVYQLDFYKNGKLQYTFCDDKQIYIIDRNGENLEGFPVQILSEDKAKITSFTVLDYDNSKNYRFAFTDNLNRIYITDKNAKKLDGWNPFENKSDVIGKISHQRLLDKDLLIYLDEADQLQFKKRNSENYKGFPVKFYNKLVPKIFFNLDKNFKTSSISVLDKEGLLKNVNFEGQILSEKQFFKPDVKSEFDMIIDALNHTFIIARKDKNALNLIDRNGKSIIENIPIGTGNVTVQYYNFGADNEVYLISDLENKKLIAYKSSGKLLFNGQLNNSDEIAMIYFDSKEEFSLYRVFDNDVSLITFDN